MRKPVSAAFPRRTIFCWTINKINCYYHLKREYQSIRIASRSVARYDNYSLKVRGIQESCILFMGTKVLSSHRFL